MVYRVVNQGERTRIVPHAINFPSQPPWLVYASLVVAVVVGYMHV